jgi:Tol biopolymer transport system component
MRTLTYSGSDRQAAASPDGKTLAFISNREGSPTVWLKRLPAGDEVALTEGGPDSYPRFSPDGSEIIFGRDGDLYRVSLLGGAPRKVVENANLGDWTPHGDRIAFARGDSDGASIHVMSADGSDERLVHRIPLRAVVDLRWSPDGRRLVVPIVHMGANISEPKIVVVDVESGEEERIPAPNGAGQPFSAAWTGSGEVLVYAQPISQSVIADQTLLVRHDLESGETEPWLYVDGVAWNIDVLGAGQVVLGVDFMVSNLQEVSLGEGSEERRWLTRGDSIDRQPIYSPDGKWLAFSTNRAGNNDIWIRNLETGEERRVTEHPAADWDPAFSPDGQNLIFSSDREGNFEIWMAEVDGRNPRRLTEDGFDAENGSMTPDGEWVVYNSGHPERAGVWKRHLESGETVQLATGVTGLPEISPDGRYVLFLRTVDLGHGTVEVVEIADGAKVPFEIHCQDATSVAGTLAVGRSRWSPDGRSIGFLCLDDAGRSGVFIQDFVPGEDTSSDRRFLMGVEGRISETFGFAPDGRSLVLSALELRQSLMLVDQLPGIERPGS